MLRAAMATSSTTATSIRPRLNSRFQGKANTPSGALPCNRSHSPDESRRYSLNANLPNCGNSVARTSARWPSTSVMWPGRS
ncbi:hypothetical protein D9M68_990120 [compost metagenome]